MRDRFKRDAVVMAALILGMMVVALVVVLGLLRMAGRESPADPAPAAELR